MNKKKLVSIGGGTGLSTLLRGLKEYDNIDIVAVVTMMDDGGSSGRLREEFGTLPPGDIRNCLLALSNREDILTKLFQYRFPVKKKIPEVGGHSLGNLLLLAISDIVGGFDKSVRAISEILAIRGKVLPVTLQTANLVAELENGQKVFGESKISKSGVPIKRIRINPHKVKHYPETVKEILSADGIIIGPGSLFTSIIPHIIIKDITDAIYKSRAKKVYVSNIMTQPGETDNYTVSDHVKKIYEHSHNKIWFDYVLVNKGKLPSNLLKKYAKEKSFPVKIDYEILKTLCTKVIFADLVSRNENKNTMKYVRHDPAKLAKALIKIFLS